MCFIMETKKIHCVLELNQSQRLKSYVVKFIVQKRIEAKMETKMEAKMEKHCTS